MSICSANLRSLHLFYQGGAPIHECRQWWLLFNRRRWLTIKGPRFLLCFLGYYCCSNSPHHFDHMVRWLVIIDRNMQRTLHRRELRRTSVAESPVSCPYPEKFSSWALPNGSIVCLLSLVISRVTFITRYNFTLS